MTLWHPLRMDASQKSTNDAIHVAIRVRPVSSRERNAAGNWQEVWNVTGNSIYQVYDGKAIPGVAYNFDQIFGHKENNQTVYNSFARDIILSCMGGMNGTIFAYGQTSSGKTHTMQGSSREPGVIPLAIMDIFKYIQQTPEREFLLRASYLEIYNENVRDLLDPYKDNLRIHENSRRDIWVGDLTETVVTSAHAVQELLMKGQRNRHVGETNMNERSSRSHTIFRMVIESRERQNNSRESFSGAVKVSCLNLVDLAGSERLSHTGAEGMRLKEGSHINKSLLTLGTVIAKLSDGGDKGHIPYRDSKLTRILQPSLGGNARTAIVCTVTSSQAFCEETHSTLKFASRAKTVTNQPEVNEVVSDEVLIKRYKRELSALKEQLSELKRQKSGDSEVPVASTKVNNNYKELQKKLEQHAADREHLTKKIDQLTTFILTSSSTIPVSTVAGSSKDLGADENIHGLSPTKRERSRKRQRTNRRKTWGPLEIIAVNAEAHRDPLETCVRRKQITRHLSERIAASSAASSAKEQSPELESARSCEPPASRSIAENFMEAATSELDLLKHVEQWLSQRFESIDELEQCKAASARLLLEVRQQNQLHGKQGSSSQSYEVIYGVLQKIVQFREESYRSLNNQQFLKDESLANLQALCEQRLKEVQLLGSHNQALQENVEKLKKEFDSVRVGYDGRLAEMEEFKVQKKTLEEEVLALNKELSKSQAAVDSMRESVRTDESVEALVQEKSRLAALLERERCQHHQQVEEQNKLIGELQGSIKELRNVIQDTNYNILALSQKNEALVKDNKNLELTVDSLKQTNAATNAQVLSRVSPSKLQDNLKLLDAAEKERHSLALELQEARSEVLSLTEEAEKLRKSNASVSQKLEMTEASLCESSVAYEREIESSAKLVSKLQEEAKTLRDEKDDLALKNAKARQSHEEEVIALSEELKELKKAALSSKAERESLIEWRTRLLASQNLVQAENEQIKSDLELLRVETQKIEQQFADSERARLEEAAKCKEFEASVRTMEAFMAAKEEELKLALSNRDTARIQLEELNLELATLGAKFAELKSSAEKHSSELAALRETNDRVKQELEASNLEKTRAQANEQDALLKLKSVEERQELTEQENSSLLSANEKMKKLASETQTRVRDLEQKEKELSSRLELLLEDREKVEASHLTEKTALLETVNASQGLIENLRGQLATEKLEYGGRICNLEEQNVTALDKLKALTDEKALAMENLEAIQGQLANAEAELVSLREALALEQERQRESATSSVALSDNLDKLRNELCAVSRDRDEYMEQSSALRKEIAELQDARHNAEEESHGNSQRVTSLLAELESVVAENSKLKELAQGAQSSYEEVKLKLQQTDAQVEQLFEKNRLITEARDELIMRLDALKADSEKEHESALQRLEAAVAEKKEAFAAATLLHEALERETATQRERASELESECKDLKELLRDSNERLELQANEASKALADRETVLKKLEQERSGFAAQEQALQLKLDELEKVVSEKCLELSKVSLEAAEKSEEFARLSEEMAELASLKGKLEEKTRSVQHLEEGLELLKSEYARQFEQLTLKEERVQELERSSRETTEHHIAEMERLSNEKREAEIAAKDAEETYKSMQGELARLRESLSSSREEFKAEVAQLKKEYEGREILLEERSALLKADHERAQKQLAMLEQDCLKANAKLVRAQESLEHEQKLLELLKAAELELKQTVSEKEAQMQAQLADASKTKAELSAELAVSAGRIEILQRDLERAQMMEELAKEPNKNDEHRTESLKAELQELKHQLELANSTSAMRQKMNETLRHDQAALEDKYRKLQQELEELKRTRSVTNAQQRIRALLDKNSNVEPISLQSSTTSSSVLSALASVQPAQRQTRTKRSAFANTVPSTLGNSLPAVKAPLSSNANAGSANTLAKENQPVPVPESTSLDSNAQLAGVNPLLTAQAARRKRNTESAGLKSKQECKQQ